MLLINENFAFRKIHNICLLIPIRRNNVSNDTIFLNDTAALIFQYCNHSDSIKALARQVFDNFVEADENEVIPELEDYIQHLIMEGFLKER